MNNLEMNPWQSFNEEYKHNGSHLLALTAFKNRTLLSHWLRPDGQIDQGLLQIESDEFPSLTPVLPEVAWDEREIYDLFGYYPQGHLDLRPLVRTPRWPREFVPLASDSPESSWNAEGPDNPSIRVQGDGITMMGVGPVHAGIIESGRFLFSLMGENVLHVDLHLFQTHRGVESLLEHTSLPHAAIVLSRVCGADSVSHQTNWAMAVEQIAGFAMNESLAWRRIMLLESERVLSHLNDLAQIPAGVGFQVAHQHGLALKEIWQQGMKEVFGHRLLFDTVRPGYAKQGDVPTVLALINTIQRSWTRWRQMVENHHGFQDRMHRVGTVAADDVVRLGGVGVVARASGVRFDARSLMPLYRGLSMTIPTYSSGDVSARFRMRLEEVEQSWKIIRQAATHLAAMISSREPLWTIPPDLSGDAVTFSESPHGLNCHVVRLEAGHIRRYHIRSGAFRNWPLLARAVTGNGIADFPLINKSFELCYSCNDR
ncbi:Ni,Fe-hydrogenase III large subunit [Sulfobacillus thermosulfidooxidans DSM 9293]|uniref:Ni,Fe-hydrogenase III large subunit n=1 Tax=Sulfobacillus thermosulfidooxidans (strain DSM 9293 / VKM B-1269 / AT-1) TaxID=929705 RepID=A0A1W1WL53_SULTA|nr:NADH-quinone oxidoreductase subunit C [Sulfobacillus thermosulfidooxidans]SMC07017.1 Ni,Fe-hydrogenase III large subunit [Sulfobacillus thermosulfidooxidans DSM 9293]